ncbi:hypothetical protein GCM10010172_59120 [Paractinoplanes ferrugineus]|uniref:Uncharacterized protein n=1 Tax=Paractinoplanes ferrugineus TaxID=113564 RepID=A0A919J5R0_9ACTN|nr:hypothetical protein [Actinoplanes ferrugineus]GIE14375.1 hypothetical protein Afe05nite_62150 [Actinoplanes ferrugineus]
MVDLSELRTIRERRARLDAEELELIDRARRAGATWAELAAVLGLTSRQAAEQRRLRLVAAVRPVRRELDEAYGEKLAAVRAAAVELHRRIGADRRWDKRFVRAVLVRETLEAAPEAPGGGLFALVDAVLGDLAGVPLPTPTRQAVERLRSATEAAAAAAAEAAEAAEAAAAEAAAAEAAASEAVWPKS